MAVFIDADFFDELRGASDPPEEHYDRHLVHLPSHWGATSHGHRSFLRLFPNHHQFERGHKYFLLYFDAHQFPRRALDL